MISEYPSSVKLIQLCTGATNGHTHGRKNLINYDFKLELPPPFMPPTKKRRLYRKKQEKLQTQFKPCTTFFRQDGG